MPKPWTGKQLAVMTATGMVLLFLGVVAGSITGTILRGIAASPLLVGESNQAKQRITTLSANSQTGSALYVEQAGSGTGVKGESARGTGGIFVADDRDRSGLLALNNAGSQGAGAALTADGNRNLGIHAVSGSGVGLWTEGKAAALYASGAVAIDGDLAVTGGCLGCSTAVLALNDSSSVLRPGNAVTITGASRDSAGTLLVTVAPAQEDDRVIGLVDVAVRSATLSVGDRSMKTYAAIDGDVPPNGTLRIVMSGIVEHARASLTGGQTSAGDSVSAGAVPGSLVRVDPASAFGVSIGYALGAIHDGLVAVLIAPH